MKLYRGLIILLVCLLVACNRLSRDVLTEWSEYRKAIEAQEQVCSDIYIMRVWPPPMSKVSAELHDDLRDSSLYGGVGVRYRTDILSQYLLQPYESIVGGQLQLFLNQELVPDDSRKFYGLSEIQDEVHWGVPLSPGLYHATVKIHDQNGIVKLECSWSFEIVQDWPW